MAVVPPWSLLLSIDRLSILFPARLEEVQRVGNLLCLVEFLGLACDRITLLLVVDSPKMWLYRGRLTELPPPYARTQQELQKEAGAPKK